MAGKDWVVRHVVCKAAAHITQHIGHLTASNEHVANSLVICHLEIKPLADFLERMTEWSMSKIVNQRCGERLVHTSIFGGKIFWFDR